MRIVALLLVVFFIYEGMKAGVSALTDLPGLLLLLVGTLGALMFGGTNIATMFKSVFSGRATADELRAGARAWGLAGAFFLFGGGIYCSIDIIAMLAHLNDPAQIGPGLSLALLPILHAVLLTFVICLPLQTNLEMRAQQQTPPA
jgi:flagellar motor component MotA